MIVVLLSRLNVEKTNKQEQEEIKARHQGEPVEKTTTTEEA